MTDDTEQPLTDRLRQASRACRQTVGQRLRTPAEVLDELARACREMGIEEWDFYAEGGPVERLETDVAELLGKPAAYFPSGTMAQQVALRVHTERAGTTRVAMPDLSHLLHHEEDGPRVLQGLRVEHLTRGRVTPTRGHLEAVPGRLAAVLV
ncbi:MAG: threonine aldolase, partial [Nocardioides sp.]|nr:threonine aldolase [Nocardioides sp.]